VQRRRRAEATPTAPWGSLSDLCPPQRESDDVVTAPSEAARATGERLRRVVGEASHLGGGRHVMPRFLARSGRGHVVEVANGLPSPAWGAAASAQGAYGFPSAPARRDLTVFVPAPGRPRRIDSVPQPMFGRPEFRDCQSTEARAVEPRRIGVGRLGGLDQVGGGPEARPCRRKAQGSASTVSAPGAAGQVPSSASSEPDASNPVKRGDGPRPWTRRRTGAVDRRHGFGRPCPLAPQESPRGLRRPRRPRSKPQRTVSPIQGIPGCPGPNLGSGVLLRRAPAPAA
jgi:hypothetical protein